jgi:hypothetical protein
MSRNETKRLENVLNDEAERQINKIAIAREPLPVV